MSGSGKKSRLLESLSADDSALRVVTMNDVDWLMSVEVLSSRWGYRQVDGEGQVSSE